MTILKLRVVKNNWHRKQITCWYKHPQNSPYKVIENE